jgi:hypothetical protein
VSTNAPIPEWLDDALKAYAPSPLVVDPSDSLTTLMPGGICYAVPMDPGASAARLVLVISVHPSHHYAEVALLSPVVENAADLDLRLDPEDMSLPFALLAQGDVIGTLWGWQLSEPIGHVRADVGMALRLISQGECPMEFAGRRGMPFSGRSDPRWRGKEEEAEALQALAADCVRTLLEPVWIDPAVLDVELGPPLVVQEAVLSAFETSTSGAGKLPGAAIDSLELDDDETRRRAEASIGADAWLLIQEMALAAVAADTLAGVHTGHTIEIPTRRALAARDPLGRALGAEAGASTVRLETWDYLWADDAPDMLSIDGPDGTIRVLRERVAA